jgi:hypothetical protein
VDKTRSPNDLGAPVPKFCLTVETFRRTVDGRVRSPQEFMQHFFPHDGKGSTDRIFKFLPNDVRGPVLTAWGLRGAKSALKDTDEKVQAVVYDALTAGDIDHDAFEEALVPEMVMRWAPLPEWWTFWRGGKLSKQAILKALETGYDLALFDAKWFFETIETAGGKLKGTDVVSEGLTKQELTEWVKKIHASGDGSPKGLLAAIGWERVVAKTPNDVLIKVLDALAAKIALADVSAKEPTSSETPMHEDERPSARMTPVPPAAEEPPKNEGAFAFGARPRSIPPPLPDASKGAPAPGEEKVDSFFGDSSPPSASDDGIAVVVEEFGDSPTGPPPAAPMAAPPEAAKPGRPPFPAGPSTPAALRGRRG